MADILMVTVLSAYRTQKQKTLMTKSQRMLASLEEQVLRKRQLPYLKEAVSSIGTLESVPQKHAVTGIIRIQHCKIEVAVLEVVAFLHPRVDRNHLAVLLVSLDQDLVTYPEEKVVNCLREEEQNILPEAGHITGRPVARLGQKERRATQKSDVRRALVINRGARPVRAEDGLDIPRNLQGPHQTVPRKRLFASCTSMVNAPMETNADFGILHLASTIRAEIAKLVKTARSYTQQRLVWTKAKKMPAQRHLHHRERTLKAAPRGNPRQRAKQK